MNGPQSFGTRSVNLKLGQHWPRRSKKKKNEKGHADDACSTFREPDGGFHRGHDNQAYLSVRASRTRHSSEDIEFQTPGFDLCSDENINICARFNGGLIKFHLVEHFELGKKLRYCLSLIATVIWHSKPRLSSNLWTKAICVDRL